MDDRKEFSKGALALTNPKSDTSDDNLDKYYEEGRRAIDIN